MAETLTFSQTSQFIIEIMLISSNCTLNSVTLLTAFEKPCSHISPFWAQFGSYIV